MNLSVREKSPGYRFVIVPVPFPFGILHLRSKRFQKSLEVSDDKSIIVLKYLLKV